MKEDRIGRESYVGFLLNRLSGILATEAPKGMGRGKQFWEALAEHDQRVVRLAGEYEEGRCEKDALDKASVAYLHAFREQAQRFRNENSTTRRQA